jgi:hypothetical protein
MGIELWAHPTDRIEQLSLPDPHSLRRVTFGSISRSRDKSATLLVFELLDAPHLSRQQEIAAMP